MHRRRNGGGTAVRGRNGFAIALPVALLALSAGPVASASAGIAIEKPHDGSTTTSKQPVISGTSTDPLLDAVSVTIHEGSASGPPAQPVLTASPGLLGEWSVTPEPLADGSYTAVAEQDEALSGETVSGEVSFTVETHPPHVTLDPPLTPSNNTKPAFSGSASDTETVHVYVYSGSQIGENPVAQATANANGGSWDSSKATPELGEGEYTAVARQASSLGNGEGESNVVHFEVVTASPHVTLNQPLTPSNTTRPAFSGTADDTRAVHVLVYAGSHVGEHPVAEATASGTGGAYTTGKTNAELEAGEYTAQAVQESSLGNDPGVSETRTFFVVTASPQVTLNQPKSPSNDTTPQFTGNAGDTEPVTVKVYAGNKPEGLLKAEATAAGTGGSYTTGAAEPALTEGTYTAIASQPSSLGNPAGKSEAVTFTVITAAPKVTLNHPKTPSNITRPTFTGTASDTKPVVIEIHSGPGTGGPVVSHAQATGTGGAWSSGEANTALTSGTYTAVATQESSLGNASGTSNTVTFVVDTSSPTVTIEQPATPSNNAKPTFSGTATDTTKVKVHIFNEADEPAGEASATPSGEHWSTSSEGELESGTYSAVATQESSLENPQGESAHVTFTVNTQPPKLTLNSPALRSNDRTPSFDGTASDTEQVVVRVYEGTKPEGKEVAGASTASTGGSFTTGPVSPQLAAGVHTYTAIASQKSSLGNPEGKSNPVTFVVDTSSPTVTLNRPPSPSNTTAPTFSGTASDTEPVEINVYRGAKAQGTPVAKAKAPGGAGGSWTKAFGAVLHDASLDNELKAMALILPAESTDGQFQEIIDFDGIHLAREFTRMTLADTYKESFKKIYQALNKTSQPYHFDRVSCGKRSLKNVALSYLSLLEEPETIALCNQQFKDAKNMTDQFAALSLLTNVHAPENKAALKSFYQQWKHDPLVMNKWLAVQALSKLDGTLENVNALMKDPVFSLTVPNDVRSLIGSFTQNPVHFNRNDGMGYAFIADRIIELDRINPQVAAGLAKSYKNFSKLDSLRKKAMQKELNRIISQENLSSNVYEIISKSLEWGKEQK